MQVTRREFAKVSLAGIACAMFPFLGNHPVVEKKEVTREITPSEHDSFIPEIWSKKLQERFYNDTILKDYSVGDTVWMGDLSKVKIRRYS